MAYKRNTQVAAFTWEACKGCYNCTTEGDCLCKSPNDAANSQLDDWLEVDQWGNINCLLFLPHDDTY